MCAINGFNFKDKDLILKMNQATSHRGPDGTGIYIDDIVSFGHNRLSIIDVSERSAQPMKSFDGALVIVFNGEIYNFQELKDELRSEYPFSTESDTEVILAAYKKWGEGCVLRFDGIFAFAIWDTQKKELFLARDHVGVKPLYYFFDGKKFIFSSEIKAILEHPIPRKINFEAFSHYFRALYVPASLTMFRDINKFPPASTGVLKEGRLQIHSFWDARNTAALKIHTNAKEKLRNVISESIKKQLISDRPLGIYLSGGIDSSIVLHGVSQLRSNIDTFSVGFELKKEEQQEKFNRDFELAKNTARYYGTNHHEVFLSPADIIPLFERAVWHMDEPISNATALAMIKLSAFSKNHADVVLGGDGGDELFGGYDRYRFSVMARYYEKIPQMLRSVLNLYPQLNKLNVPSGAQRFALFMFQKDAIINRVVEQEFFNQVISKDFFEKNYFNSRSNEAFEDLFMEADRKTWLVDYSLMLTDKMTMANGLEARVPLLGKNVVEYAMQIPIHLKVQPWATKILLKEAYKGLLPESLFREPKRGWFSPSAKWLRYPEVYEFAKRTLAPEYHAQTTPLFKWNNIRQMLKSHRDNKEYNAVMLWAILTFQLWAREYRVSI